MAFYGNSEPHIFLASFHFFPLCVPLTRLRCATLAVLLTSALFRYFLLLSVLLRCFRSTRAVLSSLMIVYHPNEVLTAEGDDDSGGDGGGSFVLMQILGQRRLLQPVYRARTFCLGGQKAVYFATNKDQLADTWYAYV